MKKIKKRNSKNVFDVFIYKCIRLLKDIFLTIFLVLLILIPTFAFCSFLELDMYDFYDVTLPAKNLKHHVLYRSLTTLDSFYMQDSKLAVLLRNKLFDHYYVMYNSFDNKKYDAIAPFYHIISEFEYYDKKQHENYKWINDKNKAMENYFKHQEKIMNEIPKIFKEYEYRNESYKINIDGETWRGRGLHYAIKDRLTFYPYLAIFYIQNKDNSNNIEELKSILAAYDNVYEQEKNINSKSYRIVHLRYKKKRYENLVKRFWALYSFPLLENEWENNREHFCENDNLFYKFLSVYKLSDKYNEMVNNIINDCNYNISEEQDNQPKEYTNYFRKLLKKIY